MSTSTSATHLLALYPHLTARDRNLLALLDEHLVLTTGQIHRLYFRAERTCQIRLRELHRLGLLERFRFARMYGGAEPWQWTLGLHGARFRAGATGRAAPTERAHREQVLRLTAHPRLAHLLATNEFFVRLACTARADPGVGLGRWWSERTATARFIGVRPDGHGLWTAQGRTVGWYLECDLGTEPLTRVVAKLEAHLQQALRRTPPPVPVATATHDTDPAGAVWLPADGWQRVPLAELPNNHGRDSASNPNWRDGQLDLSDQADLAT